jgi:transcription termination/antitermination protein NusG
MRWYALRVRAQCELRVREGLEALGIENYCPTYARDAKRTGRRIEHPYFPGYVFARFVFAERRPVIRIAQVVDVLGFGGHALAIPDQEIDAVKAVLEAKVNAVPADAYKLGDRVAVRSGPLAGLEGFVVHLKNATRLVVTVGMLNRAISAEVDADSLEVILRRAA